MALPAPRAGADFGTQHAESGTASEAVDEVEVFEEWQVAESAEGREDLAPGEDRLVAQGDSPPGRAGLGEACGEAVPEPGVVDAHAERAAADVRIRQERAHRVARACRQAGVGMEEEEDVGVGVPGAGVHLEGAAARGAGDARARGRRDFARPVGGSAVDDQHFVRPGFKGARDRRPDQSLLVERRYHDGQPGRRRRRARRAGRRFAIPADDLGLHARSPGKGGPGGILPDPAARRPRPVFPLVFARSLAYLGDMARPSRNPLRILAWMTQYVMVRTGEMLASMLSEKQALRLSQFLAHVAWRLLRKRGRIASGETTRVVGRRGRAVAAASFEHVIRTVVESLRAPRASRRAEWLERVEIVGLEKFQRAVGMGRGVIALSGHFGSFETFPILMPRLGHPVHVVRRAMDNPLIQRSFEDHWRRLGSHAIWRLGALRESLRVLSQGEILTMYVDQDAREQGVFVPFLGRPASTIKAPALLSLRTGAPIVTWAVLRLPGDRRRLEFDEPFVADTSGDTEAAVERATRRYTGELERHILASPEQWMWIHRRWKTKPGREDYPTPVPAEVPAIFRQP